MPIKGLLLDSGDTLVRPTAGAWSPGPHFQRIVAQYGIEIPCREVMDEAQRRGMDYLDTHHLVLNETEERAQFKRYYEIVLDAMGVQGPLDALTTELAHATVDGLDIEPFPETREVLEALRGRGLRLVLVSDTWPSLRRRYRQLGLAEFFDDFVISAEIGCFKPDKRMYATGIERIGLPPAELLFVDDSPTNVRKAIELGLRGILMARDAQSPSGHELPRIVSLEGLYPLL